MQTAEQIAQEASKLDSSERARLGVEMIASASDADREEAQSLLETLRRDAEMEAGTVEPLTRGEMLKRLRRYRNDA